MNPDREKLLEQMQAIHQALRNRQSALEAVLASDEQGCALMAACRELQSFYLLSGSILQDAMQLAIDAQASQRQQGGAFGSFAAVPER
jgi:hypothetical protein